MEGLYIALDYQEYAYVDTPTGGSSKEVIVDKLVSGVIRDLTGNEYIVAQSRNKDSTHRLYSNDKGLRFGGIVEGKYKITYVNRLMEQGDFYQYDMGLIK